MIPYLKLKLWINDLVKILPPWFDSWANYLHQRGFYLRFGPVETSWADIQIALLSETVAQKIEEYKSDQALYSQYKAINHLPFLSISSVLLESLPKWKLPPNFDPTLEPIFLEPNWCNSSSKLAPISITEPQTKLPRLVQCTQPSRPNLWSVVHHRTGLIYHDDSTSISFYDFFTFNSKTQTIKLNSWSLTQNLRYLILKQRILPSPFYYDLMSEIEPRIRSLTITSLTELPCSPDPFCQVIIPSSLTSLFNEQSRVIFS